ncbi:hypothetical protein B1790_23725 [Mycobacterium sp. AT1]|nr:hypothetical protein B1790_23725 [Mycobacterium sp. AT1]
MFTQGVDISRAWLLGAVVSALLLIHRPADMSAMDSVVDRARLYVVLGQDCVGWEVVSALVNSPDA